MNIKQRNTVSSAGNMSSMTDLVFLLLIFFVILSTMVVNSQEVDLPGKGNYNGKKSENVELKITADLRYSINKKSIDMESVEQELVSLMAEREKKNILLVVDSDVPTGNMVEILGLATLNDWKVSLASVKK